MGIPPAEFRLPRAYQAAETAWRAGPLINADERRSKTKFSRWPYRRLSAFISG
jgi:hypothetical protein